MQHRFAALASLAVAGLLIISPATARRAIFIEPPRDVPVSRAMLAEQLCLTQSRARTTQEATAHALWCALKYRGRHPGN